MKKAKFEDKQTLQKNTSLTLYAEEYAALKYPLNSNLNYSKEFNSLSHEVSCTLILHPNLGIFLNKMKIK